MRRFLRALRTPSLGARLVLMLTAVGIAGALGATVLLASVLIPSFSNLERRSADIHVERTDAALRALTAQMEEAARDHVELVLHGDGRRIAQPRGADAIVQIARDGRVAIVRNDARGADRQRLAAVARRLPLEGRPARVASAFFLPLDRRLVAIGIAPDARGGAVAALRSVTPSMLSVRLGRGATIDPAFTGATVVARERHHLSVIVPVPGPAGRTVAGVRFTVAREVSTLGRRLLLLAIAGSVLLLLLVLTMLRRMIGEQVLAPLSRLQQHMEEVRTSGALAVLPDGARGDEIGALGRSFNAMVVQLRALREQNAAQSFALGRSESAVAIMHNMRNALAPIGAVLSHAAVRPPAVDPTLMRRALDELADGGLPDERRARLLAFVMQAQAVAEAAEAERAVQDATARRALAHVLDIIGQQQVAAHARAAPTTCDLNAILAQQAAIAGYAGGATTTFSLPDTPVAVRADRVILTQVVGNLFANAAEAIAATGRPGGRVHVSCVGTAGQVTLRIADDGEGFDPATAPMLFRRGFSTRVDKSGGLGLHWCANALGAMDGALRLESAGKGRGATAIVTLMAGVEERAAAA